MSDETTPGPSRWKRILLALANDPGVDERDEAVDELATELADARTELQKQDTEIRRLRTLVDEAEQSLPIEQLRLLSICRMVFDRHAEGDTLSRDDAADLAQRIVDEIGHSVTEEPALGPSFRVEIAELKATLDRVRRMAQVWIDIRPDHPTATRDGHTIAWAGQQIIATIDRPGNPGERLPT